MTASPEPTRRGASICSVRLPTVPCADSPPRGRCPARVRGAFGVGGLGVGGQQRQPDSGVPAAQRLGDAQAFVGVVRWQADARDGDVGRGAVDDPQRLFQCHGRAVA